MDVLFGQCRAQVVPAALHVLRHGLGDVIDLLELFAGGEAVIAGIVQTGLNLRLQARDADHEEFFLVRGGDRKEAYPFQQGVCGIAGLRQDAGVEGEHRKLAVQEALGALRGNIGKMIFGARHGGAIGGLIGILFQCHKTHSAFEAVRGP